MKNNETGNSEELFEEELENVSGGIMTEVWLGWAGIILFLGATGMKNR